VLEYDRRENTVVLNTLRKAVDNNLVSFDFPPDAANYQEIALEPSDFAKRSLRNDKEIKG
jgi:hypothetical protein